MKKESKIRKWGLITAVTIDIMAVIHHARIGGSGMGRTLVMLMIPVALGLIFRKVVLGMRWWTSATTIVALAAPGTIVYGSEILSRGRGILSSVPMAEWACVGACAVVYVAVAFLESGWEWKDHHRIPGNDGDDAFTD